MIIVRIMGGLGNQLFQYALVRSIAENNHSIFKLDISWFNDPRHIHRKYRLNKFDIVERIASAAEIDKITRKSKKGLAKKIFIYVQKIKPYFRRRVIQCYGYRNFSFDSNILKVSRTVYLDGYWQNEKYFKDIANIIRREFSVKTLPDRNNLEILDQIMDKESICIHIRTGQRWSKDSVANPDNIEFHGVCSLKYYNTAIEMIRKKVENPHFFIFSDYMEWVCEYLKSDLPTPTTFVDCNNGEEGDFKDLRLMMHCKHHIIANSTFSWWGAWLNPNPDKIVIAPKRWFTDEKMNNQTQDLIPETWVRL